MMRPFLASAVLLPLLSLLVCAHAGPTEDVEKFLSRSGHTNNWAVLVSTSRFWFNYRVPPFPFLFHTRRKQTGG